MLPKIAIGIVLVVSIALGIFAFGILTGKGDLPPFLAGTLLYQSSCPKLLVLQTPVDLSNVTAILYPGQVRGGNFKPHGGFRFDNSKPDDIEVRAPLDSNLREAQAYMEDGEIQYMFDFAHPCGIVYRFDHLETLSPKLVDIAKNLTVLSEQDWKSGKGVHQKDLSNLNISVKQGEVIATAVGFRKTNNVFVDLGVYDLRGKSMFQNPRPHAICWFDLLPASDSAKVKSLPAGDSQAGSQSTLCK